MSEHDFARRRNLWFALTLVAFLAHNFWINGQQTPLISPGKTATLTTTLTPGSANYLCTVPGHAAAGMKGTLTVR